MPIKVVTSAVIRTIIRKTFQNFNLLKTNILEAPDGQKALELLQQNSIDLIITDYNMPIMDGPELILNIKKEASLNSIPIILLTSNQENDINNTFKGHEDFVYLKKPFLPEQLKALVKNLIKQDD